MFLQKLLFQRDARARVEAWRNAPVPARDPWARFEAWRYAPDINRAANRRRMFPGLFLGIAAFLTLVAIEELYWKPNHPEDDHHH